MQHVFRGLAAMAVVSAASAVFAGQVLYSENFDTDHTANWSVNKSTTPTDAQNVADFYYDYSAMGIPSADGAGGSTRGLRLRADMNNRTFSGLSVSPTGQHFAGDYTLHAQVWCNYIGSTTSGLTSGGSNSTQCVEFGVGTAGASAQWAGSGSYDSVFFAGAYDGGTNNTDFRVYPKANNNTALLAATGTTKADNLNAAYSFLGNYPAPALQQTNYPGTQKNSTPNGTLGFAWHDVDITKSGNAITWSIDGHLIATVDTTNITLGGDNILLGAFDTASSSTTLTGDALDLNFALFDNVTVTAVPEPASLSVLGLGALALLKRRRNA